MNGFAYENSSYIYRSSKLGCYECKTIRSKMKNTRAPQVYTAQYCPPLLSHYQSKGMMHTFTTTTLYVNIPASTPYRHALQLVIELSPVIRLKLRVLHPLLCPVLVPSADLVLGILEIPQFVTEALLDEYTAGMLPNNRFLVLFYVSLCAS